MSKIKSEVMNVSPIDFFEFVYERQAVWLARNKYGHEKADWTTDPIISKYKFCNVYRELDACSQHLIEHVIKNPALSVSDKVFNIILYRRFNVRNFYTDIIKNPVYADKFDFDGLVFSVDEYRKTGGKVFNDAYIICQRYYTDKTRKWDKAYQQLAMMRDLAKNWTTLFYRIEKAKTMKDAWKTLESDIPLTGPFLAQQYLTDITYVKGIGKKWDKNSFCSVGPGAKPALDWMSYRLKGKTYEEKCHDLWRNQSYWFRRLEQNTGLKWGRVYYRQAYHRGIWLSLSNIQNCLCEFRKYTKLKTGQVQRKRIYKGSE